MSERPEILPHPDLEDSNVKLEKEDTAKDLESVGPTEFALPKTISKLKNSWTNSRTNSHSDSNEGNEDEGSKTKDKRENKRTKRTKITCLECKEEFPFYIFTKHILIKHDLKSRQYRRLHGIARISKSSECKLEKKKEKCNDEIAKIAESERKEGKKDEGSTTAEKKKEKRRTKMTCLECKEEFPFNRFNKHLLIKHDLKPREYRRQHGISKSAEWKSEKEKSNDEIAVAERNVGNEDEESKTREEKKEKKRIKIICLECKEELPSSKLNKHLRTKHKLKPQEYRRQHGIASISESSVCKLEKKKEKCNEETAKIAESERKVGNEDEGSKEREKKRMKITCLECKEALPSSTLNKHLRTQHKLKPREYRRQHGLVNNSKSSECKSENVNKECNAEIAEIAQPKPIKLKIDLKHLKVTNTVTIAETPVVVPILKRGSTSPNSDLITNGGKQFSDILADQCIFKCEVCHQHMNR